MMKRTVTPVVNDLFKPGDIVQWMSEACGLFRLEKNYDAETSSTRDMRYIKAGDTFMLLSFDQVVEDDGFFCIEIQYEMRYIQFGSTDVLVKRRFVDSRHEHQQSTLYASVMKNFKLVCRPDDV